MMNKIIALLLLLNVEFAEAEPRVYHLSLAGGQLVHNREPMLPDVPHKDWGTAVRWEIGLQWERVFWDSVIAYESCYSKICTASWSFKLGVSLTKYLDLYWEHRSQHTFDQMNSFQKPNLYPLQDAAMLRLNFVEEARWQN